MEDAPVLLGRDARGIVTATLNRPHRGNAYNAELLAGLTEALEALAEDAGVRALVLRGAGRHFAAGADLGWLAEVAGYPPEAAFQASLATTRAMQLLNEFPRPTLALVQGAASGGGCGLVCCVDVALAVPEAVFGLTEVRVGVSPTPISPQMVQAMGLRQARRYAVTGERFDAAEALRIGLVHEVVAPAAIEARLEAILTEVLRAAPGAAAVTKDSLLGANGAKLDARAMALLSHEGWMQRATAEGREGLAAFREKRLPAWAQGSGIV
ncbi:enoyl-CoA hydratase/isomerase family protein [Belnapia sp. T18]|uniref:Enoyl-CoA hydratase/isomerase family protein n=1 Tax=Belnapia arida TaxID=2804533 RepID=A0ABS1TWH2_9PROT|nr:enoyl-CoA hydratase-related protein [Belnapia arida]MBL6076724.1 enoyl-CoA hydratase/isomerase family protein [Belnapia arida]